MKRPATELDFVLKRPAYGSWRREGKSWRIKQELLIYLILRACPHRVVYMTPLT